MKTDVAGCFLGNPQCGNVGLLFRLVREFWRERSCGLLPEGTGQLSAVWELGVDQRPELAVHFCSPDPIFHTWDSYLQLGLLFFPTQSLF